MAWSSSILVGSLVILRSPVPLFLCKVSVPLPPLMIAMTLSLSFLLIGGLLRIQHLHYVIPPELPKSDEDVTRETPILWPDAGHPIFFNDPNNHDLETSLMACMIRSPSSATGFSQK